MLEFIKNPNSTKIIGIALVIIVLGIGAAFNAKWVRDGASPWWTTYIVSFCTATVYAYLASHPLFSLTYTSAFQTFFFHASWYLTMIFVIGEPLSSHRMFGLLLVFGGMIVMSIK
jgi:hypothetical protein